MGGDDYVITSNSKHTDAHKAAHDLDEQVTQLRTLVVECRSSVKFDLLHYEKMARAYGNIGREGEQTAATAEAEAQRLHALMEKIDALALTAPNDRVEGRDACGASLSHAGLAGTGDDDERHN